MRSNPHARRLQVWLLACLLIVMQGVAAVQGCYIGAPASHLHGSTAVLCCDNAAAVTDSAPGAKPASSEPLTVGDAGSASFFHARFAGTDARALRLSRFAPQVPKLSIAQLNLRQ